MTNDIAFSYLFDLDKRWLLQAEQMEACKRALRAAPLTGLPSTVSGAATTFMKMWVETASKAKLAAEGYAEGVRETGIDFQNLEAEIAARLTRLDGDIE